MSTEKPWTGVERAALRATVERWQKDPHRYGNSYQDQVHALAEEMDPIRAVIGMEAALAAMEQALGALIADLDLRAEIEGSMRGKSEVVVNASDSILYRARAVLAQYAIPTPRREMRTCLNCRGSYVTDQDHHCPDGNFIPAIPTPTKEPA